MRKYAAPIEIDSSRKMVKSRFSSRKEVSSRKKVKNRPRRTNERTTRNRHYHVAADKLSTQVAGDPLAFVPSGNTLTLMSGETVEDDRTEENRKAEGGPPNGKSSP